MYALHGSFPQKYLLPYQKSFMYQFFKGIVMSSDNSLQKKKNTAPSPPRLLLLSSHQLFYSSSAKNIHTF